MSEAQQNHQEPKRYIVLAEVELRPSERYREATLAWIREQLRADQQVTVSLRITRPIMAQYDAGERDSLGVLAVIERPDDEEVRDLWMQGRRKDGLATTAVDGIAGSASARRFGAETTGSGC